MRCHDRILEKTCQALREKSSGISARSLAKQKKAERKVKSGKRQTVTQTNKEEQQTEKAKEHGRMSDKSNEAPKKAPPAKRSSGSREEKMPGHQMAHTTPLKIKKASTPKAKKRTHKVKATCHSKGRLPKAKKELFELGEPPKLWKTVLRDIKKPRIVSTSMIENGPSPEDNAAVQAKLSTHDYIEGNALVASIRDTGFAPISCLPPHLSAFLGAVFHPRMEDLSYSTAVEAVCIDRDNPTPAFSAHGKADAGTSVNATCGLAVPGPPRLEANHSLAGFPQEDLEVINEFDPVAAWNSFVVPKEEPW